MSFSKVLRFGAAVAALAAGTVVQTTAAQARPEVCVQWAWSRCDPRFERFTPEWNACFDQNVTACELTQGPPPPTPNPPAPPFPWPTSGDD